MATVEPWMTNSAVDGAVPARSIAAKTPSARCSGVLSALPNVTAPVATSMTVTSVNVPPMSTAMRLRVLT